MIAKDLDDAIVGILGEIYDPCSAAAGMPIGLVDMGLVLGWSFEDDNGHLEVQMCVTSACCTMAPHFTVEAEQKLALLEGVVSVAVELDSSVLWTEERMSRHGRELLQNRRSRAIAAMGIRPLQWRENSATEFELASTRMRGPA